MKLARNSSDACPDYSRQTVRYSLRYSMLAVGVAMLGASGWGLARNGPPTAQAQVTARSEYVDPAVCATCHASIAATYSKTGMGRSFHRADKPGDEEDYSNRNSVAHRASGMTYTMVQRNGKLFQRRHTVGFDGRETSVVEESVDYVIGSGNHAHTYLHRTKQGKLTELPVSWYRESRSWGMSPGYDRANQEDFRRTIPQECLFCHNGYPQSAAASSDADVFPEKLPDGIDCQRCHGPGRAHVAAATSHDSSLELIRSSIVNPRKLPRDRQMDVCMQCHLETSSRDMPNEIRAYSRSVFSYRPGQPLGEYASYFDREKEATDDTFEVAHAAYRLRKSKCFLNSQMTCLTCHNPHDIPRGKEATQTYVAVCLSCHQAVQHRVALAAGSDCISCHMPKRRTEDVVHVVMTDHFIQRDKPQGDLLAPLAEKLTDRGSDRPVVPYYPPNLAKDPKSELYVAVAHVNDAKGLERLEAVLTRQAPTAPEPYVALGRAYLRGGDAAKAIHWFEAALVHDPRYRPALRELGPALIATKQDNKAIEALRHGVALYPDDDNQLTNLGNVYLQKNMTAEARAALTRAIAANPEDANASNLLGLVALRASDNAAAERSFREAIRLQPDLAEAQTNLATLLTGKHEFAEARFHFGKALEADPASAEAHHGMGLLLILINSIPEAAAELREAVRLAPDSAVDHGDFADVLAAQGDILAAAEEYKEVLKLKPSQADAHLGLGMALLQEGKSDEAVVHLKQAALSHDPDVSETAKKALSQLGR